MDASFFSGSHGRPVARWAKHSTTTNTTQRRAGQADYVALDRLAQYVAHMKERHPGAHIYAFRYDRGSRGRAFEKPPGAQTGKGLGDRQYIVPGAGGLSEVLNNALASR